MASSPAMAPFGMEEAPQRFSMPADAEDGPRAQAHGEGLATTQETTVRARWADLLEEEESCGFPSAPTMLGRPAARADAAETREARRPVDRGLPPGSFHKPQGRQPMAPAPPAPPMESPKFMHHGGAQNPLPVLLSAQPHGAQAQVFACVANAPQPKFAPPAAPAPMPGQVGIPTAHCGVPFATYGPPAPGAGVMARGR